MEKHGKREGAQASESVSSLAQRMSTLPPFTPIGPEIFELLLPLARGTAPAEPIHLTQAIAMQLWLLFCGEEASGELAQLGRAGLYTALAALALGEAPLPPSRDELLRLQVAFERKPARTGTQRGGDRLHIPRRTQNARLARDAPRRCDAHAAVPLARTALHLLV